MKTSHGSLVPRRRSATTYAACAGACPGVESVVTTVLPSHYGGSLCGRSLSGNPFSTIGFERSNNRALAHADAGSFAGALLQDMPPAPADQAAIVAANRAGSVDTLS